MQLFECTYNFQTKSLNLIKEVYRLNLVKEVYTQNHFYGYELQRIYGRLKLVYDINNMKVLSMTLIGSLFIKILIQQ